MTMCKKLLKISVAAILLSGCSDIRAGWDRMWSSDESYQLEVGTPVATQPDIVSIKLAQAADKAAKALDTIANIEQQRNPNIPPMQQDISSASPALMQPVSLRWSGPIEQVSRILAERAGLRFRSSGRIPGIPLVVNVDAYQQPILHILRDIGLQAGSRADLLVDQNEGVVEVRYAAVDQSR
ncbi:MAG: DotD/TraH family lipoprotein [Alphaproteobacteria bacterium]|nr:DotD/TraH family lipoprotein [Alphaproteobacteria bacterium]